MFRLNLSSFLVVAVAMILVGVLDLRAQPKSIVVMVSTPPRERVWNPAFESKSERLFETLEHRLSDAHRQADKAELEKLLGEDLLILGLSHSKSQWIDLVVSGKGTFVSIEKAVLRVHILGDTAIVAGMQYVDTKSPNGASSSQFGFMNTWIRAKSGEWECVALATDQVRARN
jgi:ketosteroid isomerase-like protein